MEKSPDTTATDVSYPAASSGWFLVIMLTIAYIVSFIDRYILGLLIELTERRLSRPSLRKQTDRFPPQLQPLDNGINGPIADSLLFTAWVAKTDDIPLANISH